MVIALVLAAAGAALWLADPGRAGPADRPSAGDARASAQADVRRASGALEAARRDAARARRDAERHRLETGLEDPAAAHGAARERLAALQAQRDDTLLADGPAAAAPLERAVARAQQEVFDLRVQAARAAEFAERDTRAAAAIARATEALAAARAEAARARAPAAAQPPPERDDGGSSPMSAARWGAIALFVLAGAAGLLGTSRAVAEPAADGAGGGRAVVDLPEIARRLAVLERQARERHATDAPEHAHTHERG
jgi:hypothetical protein